MKDYVQTHIEKYFPQTPSDRELTCRLFAEVIYSDVRRNFERPQRYKP